MAVLIDKGKPLFFQGLVYVTETGGCVAVYVNLRVGHKPDKLIIGSNLTEKPVVDVFYFLSDREGNQQTPHKNLPVSQGCRG